MIQFEDRIFEGLENPEIKKIDIICIDGKFIYEHGEIPKEGDFSIRTITLDLDNDSPRKVLLTLLENCAKKL